MIFVSIDIETTGLDPETCEILEIGAVIHPEATISTIPLDELPTFLYRIKKPAYSGEPHALSMHTELFKTLATTPRNTQSFRPSESRLTRTWTGWDSEFKEKFARWLSAFSIDPTNFVAAGKNFANFDAPFLKKIVDRSTARDSLVRWHHRILDPGNMYSQCDDEFIPDTNECCRRAGINPSDIPGDEHTAIHDALVVVALIRNYWEKQ